MNERNCKACVYARPYGGEDNNNCSAWACEYINYRNAIKAYKEQVSVVKCGECEHFMYGDDYCTMHEMGMYADDYCSYGKKRGQKCEDCEHARQVWAETKPCMFEKVQMCDLDECDYKGE